MCTHLSENACGDFGITVAASTKGEERGTTLHTIAQFFFLLLQFAKPTVLPDEEEAEREDKTESEDEEDVCYQRQLITRDLEQDKSLEVEVWYVQGSK